MGDSQVGRGNARNATGPAQHEPLATVNEVTLWSSTPFRFPSISAQAFPTPHTFHTQSSNTAFLPRVERQEVCRCYKTVPTLKLRFGGGSLPTLLFSEVEADLMRAERSLSSTGMAIPTSTCWGRR